MIAGYNTLKDLLMSYFPIKNHNISVDFLNESDYMYLWKYFKEEPIETMTCRPIVQRSELQVESQFKQFSKKGNPVFLGIYTEEARPIGRISLFDFNPRNMSVEMGYFTIPAFRKKGFTKAAVSLVCKELLQLTSLNKIYAQTASFNAPSIRLLKSLHFSQDACLRSHHELNGDYFDDYIFSLIKNDLIAD